MPIELKKPISDISGLSCENCIHYQPNGTSDEDWCCINPDSYNWWRDKEDCCSLGQWFKTLSFDDHEGDIIVLHRFSTMMQLFAEEKIDAIGN